MKVLWLCNTLLPEIAEKFNMPVSKPESWIKGAYNSLKSIDDIELVYLFPAINLNIEQEIDKTLFISYSQQSGFECKQSQVEEFENVLAKTNPDVIHIFGTESLHALAMIKAAKKMDILDKTVVNIQGLVSVIAKHFFAGLDHKTIHRYTLRDLIRHNNVYQQKLLFEKRGKNEEEVLRLTRHVIGRTDWDKACVTRINPKVNYHFCNETLRKPFYENKWDIEKCDTHSIFVSQCNYPIKGFHFMLEAMADIVKEYPDAHLYTTGKNPLTCTFKQKLLQSYYSRYIGKLIKKYNLEKNVTFLGYLDEQRMCEQYLKSNVFVCCSSIENSPNSLGEAMILGVPCVSSDVGGVKNMMEHNKEGFVYQPDAPYMLSYYVKKLFKDKELALQFSKNAQQHAKITHNSEKNFEDLIKIYRSIL